MTHEAEFTNKIWHRPNGRDAEVYKALAAQERFRLAWEWLIRNDDFQRDCQAVRMGYLDADTVAPAWGLYRFKPFYEPYLTQSKPRFLVSKVRLFRAKKGQLVRHIAVRRGEMAFVLDVDRMVSSPKSRNAQIATMTRIIDEALQRRRARQIVPPEADTRVNEVNLDACLQLADLLYLDIPPAEIKQEIKYLRDVGKTNADKRYSDSQERIHSLIYNGGYLKLASQARTKKPAAKKKPDAPGSGNPSIPTPATM